MQAGQYNYYYYACVYNVHLYIKLHKDIEYNIASLYKINVYTCMLLNHFHVQCTPYAAHNVS